MKMKRLLKDFLAIGVAASFVLNSAMGVVAAEGTETAESGLDTVIESALVVDEADALQETETLLQETEGLAEKEAETEALKQEEKTEDVSSDEPGIAQIQQIQYEGTVADTVGLGATVTLKESYDGEVPAGKKFTGWDLNGVFYPAGSSFTGRADMVTPTIVNGEEVYVFNFVPHFEEEEKTVAYIRFEGITQAAEAQLGMEVQLMSEYHGEVPEGKEFAGWTLGEKTYEPGAMFTCSKELGQDMGTDPAGRRGYLFDFKASFKDVQENTVAYIRFEGITQAAEAKLDMEVQLMSKYNGEVPEGKEFAGWTLDGETVYEPGAMFKCSKDLAQDMGTDPAGRRGYLFDFKASFKDVQENTVAYIRFEGITQAAEAKLDMEVQLMSKYNGEVPEGKEFAGWTLDGKTVYAPGAMFKCIKELAQDMGTNADGAVGYLFDFKAYFRDVQEETISYIRFEGITQAAEAELGMEVQLMSNYYGEVPEGKEFAGWTLDGSTVYEPGAMFKCSKELAQDMGTNADGERGYLFDFKAYFKDVQEKTIGYIQFAGIDDFTEVELGTTVVLMSNYHGDVPAGKKFAGWTLDGKTVYAPGAEFTFSEDLAVDLGTNEDGVHGYLFNFKASFADNEIGYIQFEGIDDYTEVELGRTVILMSNYHGDVPAGKKFAGWTLDGKTVYAPGAEFTFSEDLAVDLGTNEDGVHGYLFNFKASFADNEIGYIQFEGIDDYTEVELGRTVILMSNYHGDVPAGKKFAGWTLDGNTVYAPGAEFTFSKELGTDMGTDENGVHGYLFSFKASFADNEIGYIQFEGIDDYTEVELGRTVELMSNFHGEVPAGKEFAGWTLDGETVYEPGATFTFSKDLAVDMGTNEDGVHGYLFSFKARFADVEEPNTEAPETEAPQTEAPETEAPQTEAPQTEAPQTEAPQTEAPQTEKPQVEEPQTEAPQVEEPQSEEETEEETDATVTPAPNDNNGKNDDSAKKADQTAAVKTGDNTMIMPYVISLLAAAAVIAVVLLKRRKSAH